VNALIVVAHPDDEVLGCGATAAAMAAAGHGVRACILVGAASARAGRPGTNELRDDTLRAQEVLGLGAPILGDFPNIRLNTVPHLELVQFIESAMVEAGAATLFTHHPRDLNDDHGHVARACQAAARLAQRRADVAPLAQLLLMETQSSTEWSFPDGRAAFDPDTFAPAAPELVEKKIEALACYRGVMRPAPHPRSAELVRALAALRGSQCGARYAEAFVTAHRVLDPARP
jgi:LmbE family N-acetylglucosaminyl deacetylase